MKKLVLFLTFVVVATTSQMAFSQTRQEKRQMRILEKEISKVEKEVLEMERSLEKDKNEYLFTLKKELKEVKQISDPSNAKDAETVKWGKKRIEEINSEIDSTQSIYSSFSLDLKRQKLGNLQDRREEMIASWTSSGYKIPREMTILTHNRRLRANEVRREELVLSKIENNINQEISPASSEGGYKVIFDNKYSLTTTFILKGVDGGQRMAVALSGKTKERHHVIPGQYFVEYIVGGRKLSTVSKLTVDGEKHWYESEPCFGFVYKSRY
jgi:hypothetical protein